MNTDKLLMPFAQAYKALSMPRPTAYKRAHAGKFPVPVHQINGRMMVRSADWAAFVQALDNDAFRVGGA
ncbi:hypothetical protein BJI67_07335 [Acidihalobacter aeolianus]|uniref:Helix-turn-helix domain-containing protein n=1 Tax=Acidihalobacter aeolianus TaxID=2792603 RepID=A0A1D8K7E8_9GAMM|nr:hypothetical protein BJI67_07335 [Acidihalobacter aeolianus]